MGSFIMMKSLISRRNKTDCEVAMQKLFIVSSESSLEEINKLVKENDDWFVSEISRPNNKGEWLVVLDDESNDEDDY